MEKFCIEEIKCIYRNVLKYNASVKIINGKVVICYDGLKMECIKNNHLGGWKGWRIYRDENR